MSKSAVHTVVARYQEYLERAREVAPVELAGEMGHRYGLPGNPSGAGVESVVLSQVLGCDRIQDACEVWMSISDPAHILRQRLRDYLA